MSDEEGPSLQRSPDRRHTIIHQGYKKNGGVFLTVPRRYHACQLPDGVHLVGVIWQCGCRRTYSWGQDTEWDSPTWMEVT